MRIKLFTMAFVLCYTMQNFAQQSPTTSNKNESSTMSFANSKQDSDKDITLKNRKNGLNVSFGLSGIGFGYARKLSPKFNALISYHTLKIEDQEIDVSEFLDNDEVNFSGGATSKIFDAGVEYLPFTNSSFKLTLGVGFLNDVNISGLITYKEAIKVGDVNIAPQDVGKVDILSTWSGTAPFIGFGFGRAIPKNRFGFGIDIGTYFAKSPTVNLEADKLLAPTQDEQENLQDAFESLTFIPRIQFRLTYNF